LKSLVRYTGLFLYYFEQIDIYFFERGCFLNQITGFEVFYVIVYFYFTFAGNLE